MLAYSSTRESHVDWNFTDRLQFSFNILWFICWIMYSESFRLLIGTHLWIILLLSSYSLLLLPRCRKKRLIIACRCKCRCKVGGVKRSGITMKGLEEQGTVFFKILISWARLHCGRDCLKINVSGCSCSFLNSKVVWLDITKTECSQVFSPCYCEKKVQLVSLVYVSNVFCAYV